MGKVWKEFLYDDTVVCKAASTICKRVSYIPLHVVSHLVARPAALLLVERGLLTALGDAARTDSLVEADLAIDLAHALSISSGNTDGAEQNIHLLEGQTLGLGEEEGDKGRTHEDERAEQDECAIGDTREHVWGNLTDDEADAS